MNTPICDFVKNYEKKHPVRAHMPGHKGIDMLGFEKYDITEIFGADELYMPNSIIAESEKNASEIFGARTLYSAGGSTLSIQAMVYLLTLWTKKKKTGILAARNAHRAFINACALLGADVDWIFPKEGTYHSCPLSAEDVDKALEETGDKAVYITSPDYLGNISDIFEISKVCKKHGALLAVDNAHGAYLKFLPKTRHPIDLGADMCCDSAHKTLPVITGGAYLHISRSAPEEFYTRARTAMSLFGSSSPSYLVLQSLDYFNALEKEFKKSLEEFLPKAQNLKKSICALGLACAGDEDIKLTVKPKEFGLRGTELAQRLIQNNIYPEFYDPDFTVLMLSPKNSDADIKKIAEVFGGIARADGIKETPPPVCRPVKKLSPREAIEKESELLPAEECAGRVCALTAVSCPPAIPIVICGEIIDGDVLESMRYYKIKMCSVLKK